jgi:hypothetical protein
MTDPAILAYEFLYYKHHNKSIKKGFVGIKLNMKKAYDRVEWDSIEHTLKVMGFPPNLLNVIMRYISSVQFAILVKKAIRKVQLMNIE